MSGDIVVSLPDGRTVAFPEGTPREEMNSALDKFWAANKPSTGDRILSSVAQTAGDVAKFGPLGPISRAADALRPGLDSAAGLENAGAGVARGVSGLLGMPRQVIDAPANIGNWINRRISGPGADQVQTPSEMAGPVADVMMPSAVQAQGVLNKVAPPRSPTTWGGRLAQDVGQAVGGAPFLPMMPYNIASGLGSFGAGELTNQNPVAKAAGSALGMLGPLAWLNTAPNLVKMLQRRVAQYDGPALDAAEALQAQAQGRGVPLMAQEALDQTRAGPMAQLAGTAAVQPEGAALQQFANARVMPGGAIPTAIEGAANTIGPRVANPNEVSRKLGDAADAAVRAPQKARADVADPFYTAARNDAVEPAVTQTLVGSIDDALKGVLPQGEAATNLRRLRSMLATTPPQAKAPTLATLDSDIAAMRLPDSTKLRMQADRVPVVEPRFETNVGKLDEALKELEHIIKAKAFDGKPLVPDTVRVNMQPILADVRSGLIEGSQNYRKGIEVYKGTPGNPSALTAAVEEAQASPAARIAQASTNPALESATATFGSWLRGSGGAVPAPAVVRSEVARLNKQDPEAARQALRTIIQRDADAAFKITNEGVPTPDRGVAFVKQVGGTEDTRKALLAAVEATTGNATTAKGFDQLLTILQRTGVTPGLGSPTATRGAMMNEAGQGGAINFGLQGANLSRGSALGWLQNFNETVRAGRTWGELADLLKQPDSVAQIRQLALMNPKSEKASALAATILQGNAAVTGARQ